MASGTPIHELIDIREPAIAEPLACATVEGWHALAVRVEPRGDEAAERLVLRKLESWLNRHHRITALFGVDGRPRTRSVCIAVPVSQAEKALAFRNICRELGLGETLVQWRIAGYRGDPVQARSMIRRNATH